MKKVRSKKESRKINKIKRIIALTKFEVKLSRAEMVMLKKYTTNFITEASPKLRKKLIIWYCGDGDPLDELKDDINKNKSEWAVGNLISFLKEFDSNLKKKKKP